jgi:hypothetical protein
MRRMNALLRAVKSMNKNWVVAMIRRFLSNYPIPRQKILLRVIISAIVVMSMVLKALRRALKVAS